MTVDERLQALMESSIGQVAAKANKAMTKDPNASVNKLVTDAFSAIKSGIADVEHKKKNVSTYIKKLNLFKGIWDSQSEGGDKANNAAAYKSIRKKLLGLAGDVNGELRSLELDEIKLNLPEI